MSSLASLSCAQFAGAKPRSIADLLKGIFSGGLGAQVKAILAKYGTNAHLYLPHIGVLNGLTAGNYLDSAGTTAGTVDNPVGLVLDGAGSVGAELNSNSGNPFVNTTGYTASAGAVLSVANGLLAITGTGGAWSGANKTFTTVVGKTYKITITAHKGTSNANLEATFSGTAILFTTSELVTKTMYIVASVTATQSLIDINSPTGTGTAYVSEFSVKEVTGVHATQVTTANKPILRRGAVNLLTYSEDFSNATWAVGMAGTGITATKTPNYGIAPDGTTTACRVQLNKGAGTTTSDTAYLINNLASGVASLNTQQFWAKSNDSNSYVVSIDATNSLKTITPTWTLISGFTAAAAFRLYLRGSFGTSDSADILIWHPQYEIGSTVSTYIPTTTAPASSATGNYAWQFDGSNDALALGSVPFQPADDHCIVLGLKKTASSWQVFYGQGAGGASEGLPYLGSSDTNDLVFAISGGGAGVNISGGAAQISLHTPYVLSTTVKSLYAKARLNGVQFGALGSLSGTYTQATNAYIGALGRSTLGTYMTGSLYPIVLIKGTVTDADLLILEKFVGSLSGVTL